MVNAVAAGSQYDADIAIDPLGNFVIAWDTDTDVYARRFNSQGVAQGGDFRLNTRTEGSIHDAAIAMAPDGSFAAAWVVIINHEAVIRAQRFASNGAMIGGEIDVELLVGSSESSRRPYLEFDASGKFLIAWTHNIPGMDLALARRYNPDGTPAGAAFVLNEIATASYAVIDVHPDGSFASAWRIEMHNAGVRMFDSAGNPLTRELLANTNPTQKPALPLGIAAQPNGNVAVVWDSFGVTYAQLYAPVVNPATVGGVAWHDANINGVR